eukprot:2230294-Amphidinium_carterae.2
MTQKKAAQGVTKLCTTNAKGVSQCNAPCNNGKAKRLSQETANTQKHKRFMYSSSSHNALSSAKTP